MEGNGRGMKVMDMHLPVMDLELLFFLASAAVLLFNQLNFNMLFKLRRDQSIAFG